MNLESDTIKDNSIYKLFLFSFALVLITYGFALTNYTVSIDNELPVLKDFGMDFGRWGQNFIRYHIFKGHLQYFTLLFSLFVFTLAAVRLARLFAFKDISAYIFCALFLTFPQLSYQLVFSIMADVAAIGILFSVLSIELFLKGRTTVNLAKKLGFFLLSALLMMYTFAIYQAFIVVPALIYVILFFQNTYRSDFSFKLELKRMLEFAVVNIAGILLYLLSVKIICPPLQDSEYISSFVSGGSGNVFINFFGIWGKNLLGSGFYGEKTILILTILSILLLIKFVLDKRFALIRFVTLIIIVLMPFAISFIITKGYHPPRLYVTSNLVFAFVIVFALSDFKIILRKITGIGLVLVVIFNIYMITNLFYSLNSIYKHDRRTAERIDDIIQNKYPDFNAGEKKVYFYGYFPYEYHQNLRLDNSEIFGGSYFNWDNGNNYRILNFIKKADIADYKMLDNKEELISIKDSIRDMPLWPKSGSIKMVNNIVVVRLGYQKGMPLYFE